MIKIADFGLSKSLAQNEQAAKSRSALDLQLNSPEADAEDDMEGHQSDRCASCGFSGFGDFMANAEDGMDSHQSDRCTPRGHLGLGGRGDLGFLGVGVRA